MKKVPNTMNSLTPDVKKYIAESHKLEAKLKKEYLKIDSSFKRYESERARFDRDCVVANRIIKEHKREIEKLQRFFK